MSYAGIGALSPQVAHDASAVLPDCYSELLDECLEEDNRFSPECLVFEPVHRAYEQDNDAATELVDDLDYCYISKDEVLKRHVIVGAVAFTVGAAIGAILLA